MLSRTCRGCCRRRCSRGRCRVVGRPHRSRIHRRSAGRHTCTGHRASDRCRDRSRSALGPRRRRIACRRGRVHRARVNASNVARTFSLRQSTRECRLLAARQNLRLLDPIFLLDAPAELQRFTQARHIVGPPRRNLGVPCHPHQRQCRFDLPIDASYARQIVGIDLRRGSHRRRRRAGNGWRNRQHRCNRHGWRTNRNFRGFDHTCRRSGGRRHRRAHKFHRAWCRGGCTRRDGCGRCHNRRRHDHHGRPDNRSRCHLSWPRHPGKRSDDHSNRRAHRCGRRWRNRWL